MALKVVPDKRKNENEKDSRGYIWSKNTYLY